jgi:DNA-directed RNA polymerase specialized sigma24 family protein
VLALAIDEGLSVAEIAEILQASADRVKANLWHARRRLRALLGDISEGTSRADG